MESPGEGPLGDWCGGNGAGQEVEESCQVNEGPAWGGIRSFGERMLPIIEPKNNGGGVRI